MKKIVLLFAMVFAFQATLWAQATDTEDIIFNAHLLSVFELNVDFGGTQEITFATAADYNNGVDESGGIVPGYSEITIEATEDWDLTIQCPDFNPGGASPGTGIIPIGNLGVTITEDGAHGLGTGEVTYSCVPGTPQPLTNADAPLISLGSNPNSGDAADNAFTLHWEMGTAAVGFGSTMLQQMALGNFTTGDYTTTATLTLTEHL
jgi:hypothetical protein